MLGARAYARNPIFPAKKTLAEMHVYHDPPGGHGFANMIDLETMKMTHTRAQRDAWNHIWRFLEYHLEPHRK